MIPLPMKKLLGRPKLPKGAAKADVLVLRVTDADYKIFEKAAQRAGLKVSEWARRAILAKLSMQTHDALCATVSSTKTHLQYHTPEGLITVETPSKISEKTWLFLKKYVTEVLKP